MKVKKILIGLLAGWIVLNGVMIPKIIRAEIAPDDLKLAMDPYPGSNIIRGWAVDNRNKTGQVLIRVYLGNGSNRKYLKIAEGYTTTDRPDVNAALSITGTHGYAFTIPNNYMDGVFRVFYPVAVRDNIEYDIPNAPHTAGNAFAGIPSKSVSGYVLEAPSVLLKRDGYYDYAPAMMYGDDNAYRLWWCGQDKEKWDNNKEIIDDIYYSYSSNGVNWNPPEVALRSKGPPDQGAYACDPSVLKLNISGNPTYFIYYGSEKSSFHAGGWTQTYLAIGTSPKTGFSYIDGMGSDRAILDAGNRSYFHYGRAMPSALSMPSGGIRMFYYDTNEMGGSIMTAISGDGGKSFYDHKRVILNAASPDVKYIPNLNKYVAVADVPNLTTEWKFNLYLLSADFKIEKIFTLDNGVMPKKCNHNPGILGDRYGNLPDSNKVTLVYGTGDVGSNGLCFTGNQTWDIGKMTLDLKGLLTEPPSPTITSTPTKIPTITPTPTFVPPTLTPTPTPTVVIINPTITPTPTVASKCSLCASLPNGKSSGDANCSGTTTISDAEIWREEYVESQGEKLVRNNWRADFNCDGVVGLDDAEVWREKYIELNRGE
jgi:hypothetical protein